MLHSTTTVPASRLRPPYIGEWPLTPKGRWCISAEKLLCSGCAAPADEAAPFTRLWAHALLLL